MLSSPPNLSLAGAPTPAPAPAATPASAFATGQRLLESFRHIIVISLPHRTDRRRRIRRELARLGLHVGVTPGVEFFDAIRPPSADGFPSAGRRGCFLSHSAIAHRALAENWDRVLIIEDDAVFTTAMATAGARLVSELDTHPWHIAFLGYLRTEPPPGPPAWVPLVDGRFGTHCYALHRDILPDLTRYMRGVAERPPGHPDGARLGADATYVLFCQRQPGCVTLMARPNLSIQGSSASDLAPRWFDRVPLLRHAAALARNARSAYRPARPRDRNPFP